MGTQKENLLWQILIPWLSLERLFCLFLASCKLKLKKIKWRSCAAALWIQVKCGAGVTFQSSCRVSKTFRSFFDAAADVCRRILRGLRSPSGPTELLRRTRSASRRWKTDHPSRDRPNRKKTGRRAAQPPRLHNTARPGSRAKGPRVGRSQRLSAVCWPVVWWGRTRLGPLLKAAWSCSA